ncbi:MAG TPA: DJ-1/PfpI family protein, partial [Acidimicrobiales bacterium]
VAGGEGAREIRKDRALLAWLRRMAPRVRRLCSVCTGSLVLGAAGLLRGYRATTHWAYLDALAALGAEVVDARVVVDRDRITGGGVTAGIDTALTIAAAAVGRQVAEEIQLQLQYAPEPPFASGHPATADAAVVAAVNERLRDLQAQRLAAARAAAARLAADQRAPGQSS